MISIKHIKNQKFNELKLVEILFYSFPIWFIVGNLAVSLNTLLFIIVSLWAIARKNLTFRFNSSYWILVIFFVYFFLSTLIQFQSPGILNRGISELSLESNPIFKSFLLVRFVLLIFLIDTLFYNKILNLKKLFLISLFCTSFVSLDIILQFISGSDLLGYKSVGAWNSGPFGDEYIGGSYLKNFSLFSLFYIFTNFKSHKNVNLIFIFFITLHVTAIFLSGNRMPFILFLLGIFLIFFLIKDLRSVIAISLLIFLSIFFYSVSNNLYFKNTYLTLAKDLNIFKNFNPKMDLKNNTNEEAKVSTADNIKITKDGSEIAETASSVSFLRHSGHYRIYRTSIEMFKLQPLTGFGLKSFRIKCWDILEKDINKIGERFDKLGRPQSMACASHSHNYYFEILSEAGIIGMGLIGIFFLTLLKDSFNYIKKINQKSNYKLIILMPVIINLFLEIWPLKSSGSFFTTWNATFFWLCVGLLNSMKLKK